MRKAEAFILGICLILSSMIFGVLHYGSRAPVDTIRVTGAATKRVQSDIVKWRIDVSRSVGEDQVADGYRLVSADLQAVLNALSTAGIDKSTITVQPVNSMPKYNREGEMVGYNFHQGLFVISSDLATIEGLALNPTAIFDKGVVVQSSSIEYYISNLADMKLSLLTEANADARRRAAEIARNAGLRIEKLSSARVGVFQITEPYSTEVSDYGIYSTATKDKDVTVTVQATFKVK